MPDVAGFRVLRLLAREVRADTMLAFDDGEAVVVKRFHPTTSPADVARELEALARAAGDHVVELRDVGSEADCACLIFERLAGGDLTTLLRMRGSLDAGEAVTILAPLANALARMHAAGVAHGRVTASSILFTADGSPTLIGFGAAELFVPESPEVVLESVSAVSADREALRGLAVVLLERLSITGSDARELATTVGVAAPHELLQLLNTRLFELAAPAPVRFEPDEATGATRALPVAEAIPAPGAELGVDPGAAIPRGLAGQLSRLEPVARLLDQDVAVRLRGELAGRWRTLTPRARRFLIGGIAGVGVLLVALATMPAAGSPATPSSAEASGSESAESEAAGTETPIALPDVASDPALLGDDPVAAASVLLALREGCLRSASLLCLDDVVQAGSSAEAADRAAVGVIQGGGEAPVPITPSRLDLVERLGDSALIAIGGESDEEDTPETQQASLLLMKGEAGWRIRDYVMPKISGR